MDTKSKDIDTPSEAAANSVVIDSVSQGDSNLKSGKGADASEKVSEPIDREEDIDEDLLLCTSSDIEAFEDKHGVKEIKKKPADIEKIDNYFSDIESSDNSQEYEEQVSVEKNAGVAVEKEVIELAKEEKPTDMIESEKKHKESEKTTELELEPVESDEEEFDESVKKTEEASLEKAAEKETTPDEISKELEDISDKEGALSQEEEVPISIEGINEDIQAKDQRLSTESRDISDEIEKSPKAALIENKCEKAGGEEAQVAEGKAVAESDPKEEATTLEVKEKTGESSAELGTEKEDAAPVSNVGDLEKEKVETGTTDEIVDLTESAAGSPNPVVEETDKADRGKTDETVELKESAAGSPNPIVEETDKADRGKTDETVELTETPAGIPHPVVEETDKAEQGMPDEAVQLKESAAGIPNPTTKETNEEIDKDVQTTTEEENKDPDVKLSSTAETSEKLNESIAGDSAEEVKEREPEKTDEIVLPITEEVSKDPPASSSAELSSTSQPLEGLDSTSNEDRTAIETNITPKNTHEAIASPEEEVASKETETIAEKEDVGPSRDTDIQAEDAPNSDKSGSGEAEAKITEIQTGDSPKSDKSGSGEADPKSKEIQTGDAQKTNKTDLGEVDPKSKEIRSENAPKSDKTGSGEADPKGVQIQSEDTPKADKPGSGEADPKSKKIQTGDAPKTDKPGSGEADPKGVQIQSEDTPKADKPGSGEADPKSKEIRSENAPKSGKTSSAEADPKSKETQSGDAPKSDKSGSGEADPKSKEIRSENVPKSDKTDLLEADPKSVQNRTEDAPNSDKSGSGEADPKGVQIQSADAPKTDKPGSGEADPKSKETQSGDAPKSDKSGSKKADPKITDPIQVDLTEPDAKDAHVQAQDAQNSHKPDLERAGKTEVKTEDSAEEDEVLVVIEIESEAEDKQGENVAGIKEEKKETAAPAAPVEEKALESILPSDENKVEPDSKTAEQTKDIASASNATTQPADEPKAVDCKDKPPTKPVETTDEIVSDENSYLKDKLTTKVSELMKTIDTSSLQGLTSDDDESLLVIDTTHKEDIENEDIDMDTETEQTVATGSATDSSSDGSLEIFYDKECSNYDCQHGCKNFYRAPQFALSYYKVSKKRYKPQFVCEDCYDQALHEYEEMCIILKQRQPLYGASFKRQDFVEIIDSSDEEDTENNADNCRDENTFPKESIEFLENELEGIIRNVMQSVDIQNQLSWTKQVLQQSLDRVKEESSYVSDQLQQLQKKADKMHNSLYQCPSIKIRQLTPLDLNSGRSYSPESESTIPAIGDVDRPSIQLNETYYAVKNKAIASWVPCKVVEEVEDSTSQAKNLKHFKIKFLKSKYPMLKTLSAKHMAYFDPPRVRLPIGTRVIAYFDASSLSRGKEKMLIPSAFYPGIIAEPLKTSNKYRYLVFYDDGYFQYVSYKDVRLVCHSSENVWDDVHHQSREFIQNYLTQYAVNRPMVQTQKGQCMLVDYNGKWVYARVVDVDCSLVQMMFEGHSRSEWIYRGSTRLGPVYKESNNIAPKTSWNQSRISRRTEPFIRYFNDEDSSSPQHNPQSHQQHQAKSGEVRSVAKKSVSRTEAATGAQPVPVVKHLNNSTIFVDDDNKPKGKVVYYTARKNLPPRDFVPHMCSPSCPFVITHNLQFYSPLAKPLLSGWERQVFRQKSKRFIVYRGPCGKRLRNMDELHRYLRVTSNELNVDNFDFSSETNCLAEYVIESCIVQKKDISNGEEKMPIPCVNYYDNTMPPDCKYSSRRIPTEGVHLNVDSDFLVGCDCEDDCSDKSKCSCWQLTYAGAKYSMPNVPHEMVGYQYKRLYAHVPTGIYECNSRCKCKANCVNRVVQQSLQSKLQVFKTSNRGWGLRCINDVPRGSFICIYAGHLLTEQKANEGGLDAGDEYFAELDYIEVAEQIKEGYESDVVEPDEEEDMYNPDKDDDDDEFVAPGDPNRNKSINTRLSTRRVTKTSSDAEHDSQERQVISFEPKKFQERPNSATERTTMRRLFGRDEGTYIMDAKITGNLGRYFNHSCSPNLFVQNVFVDTHDLRFPWVAFFAFSHIRAGTELTWNYNYEVGVVPGKVLYCQCGAPNCRQRLL